MAKEPRLRGSAAFIAAAYRSSSDDDVPAANSPQRVRGKARRGFYEDVQNDPAFGVPFISPDLSAWEISYKAPVKPKAAQERLTRAAAFKASVDRQAASREALKPSQFKGAPVIPGNVGVRSPNKRLQRAIQQAELKKEKFQIGNLFEIRSPTAREARISPFGARQTQGVKGTPVASPRPVRAVAPAKATQVLPERLGAPSSQARASRTSLVQRRTGTEVVPCVERPEGTTDNKNGRRSARFVPWCK